MSQIQVLIVEDNRIVAADIANALTQMGYRVSGMITKGEEVLDAIQTYKPDVILMDVSLEGKMDGVDAAKAVLEKYRTPVIFLTANSDRFTFERAKETQPYAFLIKPFDRMDLEHTIELAISRYSQTQQAPLVEQSEQEAEVQEEEPTDHFLLDDRIFVKVKDELVKIYLEEILWIEADNNYCFIFTPGKKHLVTVNLKTFANRLQSPSFLRVHRSYIVNLAKLDKIGELYLTIHGNQIPISKSYRAELMRRLQKI